MSAVMQKMSEWEHKYRDIVELYALNEELLATVHTAQDPEAQFAVLEELIETIGSSTDVLTEEYVAFCDAGPMDKKRSGNRVEAALRKVYVGMHGVAGKIRDARNLALLVMKKIKRQLESIISHFVEFTTLSLDRIMQKHDVEELMARHANIARMLTQLGQGA